MFLELQQSTVGYKTPLIEEVSTGLDLGEICLLVGNNGVGKTTLIKSILNQTLLLSGSILLEEKSNKSFSNRELAEKIAVVFSKSRVPANFTLADLIGFGKYIHYPYYFNLSKEDQNEVEEIIERLNLTQYTNFPLQKLSDGNLQKAFIGRALAQNSPMIILDEPTTHLDEENKIIILKLLRNLARTKNKLILFSSHDWRLAKEFADKMWLVNSGRMDSGITEELLLKHHELLNPQLFHMSSGFIAPQISAPTLEKEMLFSYLQKNFAKDLSKFQFKYLESFWTVTVGNQQKICTSFAEIALFINKQS